MHLVSVICPIVFCISLWSIVDSVSVLFSPLIGYNKRNLIHCPTNKCNNDTKVTQNSQISGCQCDLQCQKYGDCCQDAPMAPSMNLSPLPKVNCSSVPSIPYSIYTISWCSSPYTLRRTMRNCQASSNYTEQTTNPQSKVPVTDLSTNITYGNVHCARCNHASNYVYWLMNLTCPSHNETVPFPKSDLIDFLNDRPSQPNKFSFNNETNLWQFTNEKKQNENCTWIPVLPDSVTLKNLRRCEKNVVSECPSSIGTAACPGYIAFVMAGGKTYRNEQCAQCNDKRHNIFCLSPRPQSSLTPVNTYNVDSTSPRSRSSTTPPLVPSSLTKASTARLVPTSTTVTSTFTPSTVTLFTPSTNEWSVGERVKALKNKKRAYMYIQINANCEQIMNHMNITRVVAETVYYQTLNRTFVTDTKKIVGTAVKVCDMTNKGVPHTEYEYFVRAYRWFVFTYIIYDLFISASALLILIYLGSYAISKMSSTVYSKALASFAFILFLAHLGTILVSIVTLTNNVGKNRFCLLHFLLEYYGHLAARFWLVSIAFEVTACLWEMGSGSATSSAEGRWTRFTVYSWLSWLVPSIIIGTTIGLRLNIITADTCSLIYDAHFHDTVELFSITVSVSMTTALYFSSFYVVRTQTEAFGKLSRAYGIDFSLYTILIVCAVLMNLTNLRDIDVPIFSEWFLFCFLNFILAIMICLHSYTQNALLNNLKLYVDKYIKNLIL